MATRGQPFHRSAVPLPLHRGGKTRDGSYVTERQRSGPPAVDEV